MTGKKLLVLMLLLPVIIFAATTPKVLWTYNSGGYYSAPAVDNGRVYVGVNSVYFVALDAKSGKEIWKIRLKKGYAQIPSVASNGTIYLPSADTLYSISSNGKVNWTFKVGDKIMYSSPTLASDGTIYIGSRDGYLYAITPDGKLKWKYKTRYKNWIYTPPIIGSDGTIYFGCYDRRLYALNPDGTLKWAFVSGSSVVSPVAIGKDGTIYVNSLDQYLYALNPNGKLKWNFRAAGRLYAAPVIGKNAVYIADQHRYLYSITFDGKLNWKVQLPNQIKKTPVIGYDDTLYVPVENYNGVVVVSKNGKILFTIRTKPVRNITITSDGIIYCETKSNVMAIKVSEPFENEAQWPMFAFNSRHAGRRIQMIGDPFAPSYPVRSNSVSQNFEFKWANPFSDRANVKYTLYISTSPSTLKPILTLDTNHCKAFNFTSGKTYYWKVSAVWNGQTISSEVYSFKVK